MSETGNFALNTNQDINKLISSYNRFVPYQILKILGKNNILDIKLGDQIEKNITILFSDIRDFTSLSETLSPQDNFNFINSYLSQMEPLISSHFGIIDKFIGDSIMAIFPDKANDALDCSILMLRQLNNYNEGRLRAGYKPINIGIGLNTGLSMLGTVGGFNRMECTVISDAVNLASRIESTTKKYGTRLLISENTYHNIENIDKYNLRFIDRILIKGKSRPQSVYEVYNADDKKTIQLKNDTKAIFEEALACYHFKEINQSMALLKKCLMANPDDKPAQVYLRRCKEFEKKGIHFAARELSEQLSWNSSFETGIEIIDKQHYDLFSNSIKLIRIFKNGNKENEIDQILKFLDNYVSEHFNTEEKLMADHNYTFLEHQKAQHKKFIKSFNQLKKEIKELKIRKIYLMFRIQIFLIDWLVNHTLKEDKHFGKYLLYK